MQSWRGDEYCRNEVHTDQQKVVKKLFQCIHDFASLFYTAEAHTKKTHMELSLAQNKCGALLEPSSQLINVDETIRS